MRIPILAVAGVLSLAAATANAASPGSSERPIRMGAAPGIVQVWAAAARVGTQCPVIGANGGANGFRRIARQTGITAASLPIGAGEVLTTEAGARPEVDGPYGGGGYYGGGGGNP
jgi:hypothetical protein